MIGCFVTGTDTGVGKTLVSTGLLHALAPHHRRVVDYLAGVLWALDVPASSVAAARRAFSDEAGS